MFVLVEGSPESFSRSKILISHHREPIQYLCRARRCRSFSRFFPVLITDHVVTTLSGPSGEHINDGQYTSFETEPIQCIVAGLKMEYDNNDRFAFK